MGCEPRRLSPIRPRRDMTSRARAACKFVSSGLLATIALLAASTAPTHAQSNWTGAVSNGWFNPLNWSPVGVPGVATDAIINTVTPNSTEIGGGGATALTLSVGANGTGMLVIQNGGTLTDIGGFIGNLPGGIGVRDRIRRGLHVDERRNPRGRRLGHRHAYHPKRRCGEQWWRRLRRIVCRLDGTVTVTGPGSTWNNSPVRPAGSISAVLARARLRSQTVGRSTITPPSPPTSARVQARWAR